jgi:hypothetical protein
VGVVIISTKALLTWNREGASPGDRWKWNETIGPVQDRPGRQGNTHASFQCPY